MTCSPGIFCWIIFLMNSFHPFSLFFLLGTSTVWMSNLLDLYLSLLLGAFLKFTYGFLWPFLSTLVFLFSKNYCLFLNFYHIFLYLHWCKIFSYYFKNWYVNIMLVFFCLHRLCFLQVTFFPHLFSLLCFFLNSIFRCLMILDYPRNRFL